MRKTLTTQDRPDVRMMPAVVVATVAVVFGDAVASTSGIDHGPEYGFYGVIIASVIGAIALIFTNRRRRFPETPDVAAKLEVLLVSTATLQTQITDDRAGIARRLEERDKVIDEKFSRLTAKFDALDSHLRPYPPRKDPT